MATRRRRRPTGATKQEERDLYDEDADLEPEEDEDDVEEERPRRGRKSAPARSRRRDDDEEDDEPRGRRRASRRERDDDDDEDDRPDRSAVAKRGWSGQKALQQETSDFAPEFKLDDEPALVIFLEEEPVVSYNQHWIERQGKRSFTCIGKDCPLCKIGDKPRTYTVFNIAVLVDPEDGPLDEPVVMLLRAGSRLTDTLSGAHVGRSGPLHEGYWQLYKTGKKQKTQYHCIRVKERDVEEDWEIDPLTDDDWDALVDSAYPESEAVQIQSKSTLREIADEVVGDD